MQIKRVIKIFLLLLVISGIIFGFIKKEKLKRYIRERRYHSYLVAIGMAKKCYHPGEIMTLFKQENLDFAQMDNHITSESLNKLLDSNIKPKEISKIPLITHHIYFTSTTNPIKLPEFYIEKIIANYNKLNELNPNWQHFIWTNDINLFPKELLSMKGVEIKNIESFKDHDLYGYLAKTIQAGNDSRAYFSGASDILRNMALQKFGGIYTDIDYEIYNAKALFELMHKFDFIGGREWSWQASYYGSAFMVAKPNHPVINEVIRRIRLYNLEPNNPEIPDYERYPCSFAEKLYTDAPPLYTVSYFKKNNIDGNNDIILPSWMAFNVNFAYMKNGECKNIIKGEEFNNKNQILSDLILDYQLNYKIRQIDFTPERKDIYYNLNSPDRAKFPIIGADMFCGTWTINVKNRKYYYWNWPFSLFFEPYED